MIKLPLCIIVSGVQGASLHLGVSVLVLIYTVDCFLV